MKNEIFLSFTLLTAVFLIAYAAYPKNISSPQIEVKEFQSSLILPRVKKEIQCLADNMYFEAVGEPYIGQKAVALVTLNRVKSPRFPDSICGVVKQGIVSKWHTENTGKIVPIKHKCQFSWWCDGKPDVVYDRKAYESIYKMAKQIALNSELNYDITGGALWYHADYVAPSWRKMKVKTVKIGQHIFYKDKNNGTKTKLSSNRRAKDGSFVLLADGRN